MHTFSSAAYAGISWILPPIVVFTVTLFAVKLINQLFPGDSKTRQRHPNEKNR